VGRIKKEVRVSLAKQLGEGVFLISGRRIKWMAEIIRWREERASRLGKMNSTTTFVANSEESRQCNPIGCFWLPFDTRLVPNEREARGELTGEGKGRRGWIGVSVWLEMVVR
jgi:hypothetical protein